TQVAPNRAELPLIEAEPPAEPRSTISNAPVGEVKETPPPESDAKSSSDPARPRQNERQIPRSHSNERASEAQMIAAQRKKLSNFLFICAFIFLVIPIVVVFAEGATSTWF